MCGSERCTGVFRWDEDKNRAYPCQECRIKRLIEVVPRGRRIPLTQLEPFQGISRSIDLQGQAKLIDTLQMDPFGCYTLLGPTNIGKTQALYSLYLHVCCNTVYGDLVVLTSFKDLLDDMRDYEFRETRTRLPRIDTQQIDEILKGKRRRRVSVFIDEFDKGGTHTEWAMNAAHNLVDTCYRHSDTGQVQLCLTANCDRQEFIAQFGASLVRRLEDMGTLIEKSTGK